MFRGQASKIPSRIPYSIIIPTVIIVAMGVINLSSAAQATRPDLYLNQLLRFVLAFILFICAAFMHPRIIRDLAFVPYAGAILLLVFVLLIGVTAKGGERWLVLGPFRIQPSDPAKLAIILAIARYCSLFWPQDGYSIMTMVRPFNLSRPIGLLGIMVWLLVKSARTTTVFSTQLLTSTLGKILMVSLVFLALIWLLVSLLSLLRNKFKISYIIAPIDIALLPFLLIAIEPDLATGLVVLSIAGSMFLYVGVRKSSLVLGILSVIILGIIGYFTLLMDYQKQRIISFLNPQANIQGEGYQAMQSIIAIGSGRIFGKGYNGGTQTQLSFLPENSTDFVFSVWAEEWGFVACVCLIGLYFLLISSILKMAIKVDDLFSQLLCVGVAAYISIHVVVNIGMVTGLLPVAGIPLLLMSYGGSSLNITLLCLGLIVNVALWRGEK
jgi:cell division protein FtsW (lipid II flippase)